MKKSYKIEVDCANCAQKMEDAANTVAGVAKATVSFMTQKMNVEFDEGADVKFAAVGGLDGAGLGGGGVLRHGENPFGRGVQEKCGGA